MFSLSFTESEPQVMSCISTFVGFSFGQVGTTISSSSRILKLLVALSACIKDSKLSDLPRVEGMLNGVGHCDKSSLENPWSSADRQGWLCRYSVISRTTAS
uniref:Uncharacterized protein n=1 Tax=Arundo donax TaxID=35708 RepID=A0A0A9DX09_ARUDO